MLVTIITPTTHSRADYLQRLSEMIQAQDYPQIEWRTCYENFTIGKKRNILCEAAEGEIIVHFDSDDCYSPNYISKAVAHLLSSGANITGLSSAYFYDTTGQLYDWTSKHQQPYVIEATMCYYKSMWANNPFPNTSQGEGRQFLGNAGLVSPHGYKDGFTAIIHGSNTECHKATVLFDKIPFSDAPDILRKYYPK